VFSVLLIILQVEGKNNLLGRAVVYKSVEIPWSTLQGEILRRLGDRVTALRAVRDDRWESNQLLSRISTEAIHYREGGPARLERALQNCLTEL
jgi:hypothetical protein